MSSSGSGSGSQLTLIFKFGMVHMSGIYKRDFIGLHMSPGPVGVCEKRQAGRQAPRG